MKKNLSPKKKRKFPKTILRLPDLDHAKAAVLNSLTCPDAQRGYRHAIDEFIDWYCSEPRLGVRLGNWLASEQSQALWQAPDAERLKGKRDRALLAVLLARGLRRHEAVELTLEHLQQREEHWAIVDLIGKAGHVRTIPLPGWVRQVLDDWFAGAGISCGKLFRCVSRAGRAWGEGMTEKVVWHVVKEFAAKVGGANLAPHDLRSYAAWKNMPSCPAYALWFPDFLFDDSA